MSIEILNKDDVRALKPWLDGWVEKVETEEYIDGDPVQFMHAFEDKRDREIAGFFAAIMAWGRRDIVNRKVGELLTLMDNRPAEFIAGFNETDAGRFRDFKHRTFKPVDIYWIAKILHRIVHNFESFEGFWAQCREQAKNEGRNLIAIFHEQFFSQCPDAALRTRKHISNPEKNSACKRLYLYLKWNIRKGSAVDPGIMDFMPPSELIIPLDVHVARQARALGLLERSYNDWKAATELTEKLRWLDPEDPVKYDYALFGLGVSGEPVSPERLVNPDFIQV